MSLAPTTEHALDHHLATEQRAGRLPSLVGGVVRDGRLAWSGAVGTLDARADGPAPGADTQYRLGSITKTFVAVEVLRLRDAGALDLGDPIDRHLPELDLPITVAQLLTHTSGLQAETHGPWWERTPGGSWDDLVATGLTLRATPGTGHHYSNVGYAVLGELVARLRDTSWHDAIRVGLLEPLGMTRTTTRPAGSFAPGLAVHPLADLVHVEPEHDHGALGPAGQLWSTIEDMTDWAELIAGAHPEVIAPATLTEMLRPAAVSDLADAAWTVAHGLGWQVWNVDGRRAAGHGGSMPGFLAGLRVDLESGDGVVLMTNATSGLRPTAIGDLMTALHDHEPPAAEPWAADASQRDQVDLVGPWFWGPLGSEVRTDPDGGFRLGVPGQGRGSRFVPADRPDTYVGLDGYFRDEPLEVERAADGSPHRLVLASFVFTRTPYASGADVPGGLDPAGWH